MNDVKKEILSKKEYGVDDLRTIMQILRSEEGCPWDREQDHRSIRNSLIEETYEAVEAIDKQNDEMLREELGDVLLQVVFHAQIAQEEGAFTLDDVANDICRKMIVRHPHVFGDVVADTSDQVLVNWDAIKQETKGQKTLKDTLEAVSPALPSLMRAGKIAHKAEKAGVATANESVLSELEGLSHDAASEKIASMLYSYAAAARRIGEEPEQLLQNYSCEIIKKIT